MTDSTARFPAGELPLRGSREETGEEPDWKNNPRCRSLVICLPTLISSSRHSSWGLAAWSRVAGSTFLPPLPQRRHLHPCGLSPLLNPGWRFSSSPDSELERKLFFSPFSDPWVHQCCECLGFSERKRNLSARGINSWKSQAALNFQTWRKGRNTMEA